MANYSLFDAASLVMIPTGTKDGKLYSIKPVPVYGSELIALSANRDFSSNTGFWTFESPQVTYGTGKVDFNTSLTNYGFYKTSFLVPNKSYIATFDIVNYTSGAVHVNGGGLVYGSVNSNGTHRISLNSNANGTFAIQSDSGGAVLSIDNVSIKEILVGDGDFDFTRATSANRINSDNLIESVGNNVPRMDYTNGSCPSLLLEPQSTNLINYPVSFTNSYWTKSGATIEKDPSTAGAEQVVNGDFASNINDWAAKDSTIIWDNGKLKCNNSSGNGAGGPRQNVGLQNNKTYIFTATIQLISATANGTFGIFTSSAVGTGQSDVYYGSTLVAGADAITETGQFTTGTDGDVSIQFWVDRPNAVFTIDNVSVKEVQGFSSPSADYTTSAFKLTEGTATSGHSVYRIQGGLSSGADYTQSFFVKASERYKVKIKDAADGTYFGAYNLTTGVLIDEGSNSIGGTTIEALSNGWYRLTLLSNQATAVRYPQINLLPNDYVAGDSNSYTGDGTSGVYLFGAQLEQQSYPTSFIYNGTEGSSVTRVAETCGGAGDSTVFNSTEGVLYAEAKTFSNTGSSGLISLSNGTTSNRVTIELDGANIKVRFVVGGSSIGIFNYAINIKETLKIAAKYKANDFALWVNGTERVAITSGSSFSNNTLSELSFDRGDGNEIFLGNVKQVITFNTALTDTELATLTTL